MKKFLSIVGVMLAFAMLFTACSSSKDDPFEDLYKYKSTLFAATAQFGGDVLKFVDIKATYTGMDGTTKTITPNTKGEILIDDRSDKLPIEIKVVFQMTKKADYEETKASQKKFDLSVSTPAFIPAFLNVNNDVIVLGQGISSQVFDNKGVRSDDVDQYFNQVEKYLNVTFSGEFVKKGDRAEFVKK